MSVLITGSIALDDVKTPFGKKKNIVGGSAVFGSIAASFFAPVKLVGAAGRDFPKETIAFLNSRGIDTSALKITAGKTFHWEGFYEYDMNQAHTIDTKLNSLNDLDTTLPEEHRKCEYVFLANLDPAKQLEIIRQLKRPKLIVADTMNYWIESRNSDLRKVIKSVDIMLLNDSEARQLTGEPNLIRAAKSVLAMGARCVIIKKGEHGALLFSRSIHFSTPSYPQENFIDPTGAGDTFAGGLIGSLAKSSGKGINEMRHSVVMGSVMASFNVEDFSYERLKTLRAGDIVRRFDTLKKCSAFDGLPKNYFK